MVEYQSLGCSEASYMNPPLDRLVLVRADGNAQIGNGHVMRCLALAQGWQDRNGSALFALHKPSVSLAHRVRAEGVGLAGIESQPGSQADAHETIELARRSGATLVIIDGYHFDSSYLETLKSGSLKLLLLDDYGDRNTCFADVVLNHNPIADGEMYSVRSSTSRLILGGQYCLLRREFTRWRDWTRDIPTQASKVLVSLGGSDPDFLTQRVMQYLQNADYPALEVVVVVGPDNLGFKQVMRATFEPSVPIQVVHNAENMAELMACADVAITIAGGTLWELLFMGCPTVVFARSQVQNGILRSLEERGVLSYAGYVSTIDSEKFQVALRELIDSPERRSRMTAKARSMIDGRGAERVAEVITSLFQMDKKVDG